MQTNEFPQQFRTAFEAWNGRVPTIDETKNALRIVELERRSGLHPAIFQLVLEAKKKDEQAKALADFEQGVASTALRFRRLVPSHEELTSSVAAASALTAAIERGNSLPEWKPRSIAILLGAILAIGLVVSAVTFAAGRSAGAATAAAIQRASNDDPCQVLRGIRHDLVQHRDVKGVGEVTKTLHGLGC